MVVNTEVYDVRYTVKAVQNIHV